MRRYPRVLLLIGTITVFALFVWRESPGALQRPDFGPEANERPAGPNLPLRHIVLFNSGVGYFQREGEINGDSRVDLQFPTSDINDLLKSLVLQDLGHGKITTVSYDGQEPIERTLKSFAIDLTGNPAFGELLNQLRGEKVEVTLQNSSGTLTGTIIGMEAQTESGPRQMPSPNPLDDEENQKRPTTIVQPHEIHRLNLLCAEGIRSLPLNKVLRVRFLNAALEGELQRALSVLANAHNSQKKNVSVQFSGEGKRMVKVGYVVEAPMWKSSYRLVLDKTGKTTLQGWAIIENTSDEDWKDVRMALVSSRPISFQMDLYPPLFVPRPVVEPERFASLRPPEYQGPLANAPINGGGIGGIAGMGGIGGIAGLGGGGFNMLGAGGGFQGGFQGSFQGTPLNRYQGGNNFAPAPGVNRLTYEQLQQRRQEREKAREEAKKTGGAIDWGAEFDPISSVNSVAHAEKVGEQTQYLIDHKIALARQRSALLPVVNREITAQRVSIFNEKVNGTFPLRGLKIKNATGQNLMQGPVSVYEGGSYAGDARLPDLQANEERLLSFAVDRAVEVKSEGKNDSESLALLRIVKGVVQETHRQRSTTKYFIRNRSDRERTLIVEHPIRPNWKLIDEEKPSERTRDAYRFEWKVPAGKGVVRQVVEERTTGVQTALLRMPSSDLELLIRSSAASPKLNAELRKVVESKNKLSDVQKELGLLQAQFKETTQEQNRIRTSLDKVPANTALHKRYLEKLDKLETDIETLQKKIKQNQEKEKKQAAEFEKYLAELTVE